MKTMGYSWKELIETITISIFYSKSNVNNRNDMAAHSICAYLSFCQQPHKIELNSCQASADMPIEGLLHKLQIYSGVLLWCQILIRQLFSDVRKLLIFNLLFLLSNLKYISNKCFQDQMWTKCQKDFLGNYFRNLETPVHCSVYLLCFHYQDLSDKHLTL